MGKITLEESIYVCYNRMMTIGINGNEANVEHRVGVGQYAFELLKQLKEFEIFNLKPPPERGLAAAGFKIYLSSAPREDMPAESESWKYQVFGPDRLWTATGLQIKLLQEKLRGTAPDVFFTPTHYTPFVMPMPSVISIMDLAFEKFPQYFKKRDLYQLKYWTRLSALQARKILTISQATKEDICRIYRLPEEKVVVIYPGYDKDRFNPKVKASRNDKYLLYVGTLQPRKNLVRLIQAFGQLSDKKIKLVIAGMISEGRGGWMYQEIFDQVKSLGLEKRVEFTGYVPDQELPGLMKGAVAYVLPSLYEGFGIPAIEAMATGVPIVVSRVPSLPEVCGEAVVYIDDPYQVSSIKGALEQVLALGASEKRKRLELGLEWVKRYNWKTTAKKTLEVLRNV